MSAINTAVTVPADAAIDITNLVCPLTIIKVKTALEELEDGQVLEVRLNDGEPMQSIPRSLKDHGHKVREAKRNDDGTWTLSLIKGRLG